MSRGKSNKASSSFNEENGQLLQNINKTVKGLKEELKSLREELNKSKKDLKATKVENQRLKQALNLTNSKLDDLQQYGRRENIRIRPFPKGGHSGQSPPKIFVCPPPNFSGLKFQRLMI